MRRINVHLLLELLDIWEAKELNDDNPSIFDRMDDDQYELWLKIQKYRNLVKEDLAE